MIPVLGLLVCGYIIVRMVELMSRKGVSALEFTMAGVLVVGCVGAAAYFLLVGGITSAPRPVVVTDTVASPR